MLIGSYIYIPVSDLEKAADWYEKNITSQMEYSTGQQPAYGFCVDDLDGNKIEIWEDYEYDAR